MRAGGSRIRAAARRWWLVTFAVGMVAVPLAFGIAILGQADPPREEPVSLGFVPPVDAKPGRGFAIGVAARLESCDRPLDVTVVAAGTAEYWIDNAQELPRSARFQLALPHVVEGRVQVSSGTTATDVADPDTTELRRDDPSLLGAGDFRLEEPRRIGELTVIAGTIRNWPGTLVPIIAHFRADWIEPRGLGTCFVRLPALAGDLSVLAAQRVLGNADAVDRLLVDPGEFTVDSRRLGIAARYTPTLEIAYGSSTVRVRSGSIDIGQSLPPPSESINGNPTWTCTGRARSARYLDETRSKPPPDLLLGDDPLGSAGALSISALRAGPAGDCSAVVAVGEASAPWKRDLVLLLIGAAVSLGVTILVEFAIGVRQPQALPEAGRAH